VFVLASDGEGEDATGFRAEEGWDGEGGSHAAQGRSDETGASRRRAGDSAPSAAAYGRDFSGPTGSSGWQLPGDPGLHHDSAAAPSASGAARSARGSGASSSSAVLTRGLTSRFGAGLGASAAARTTARTAVPSVMRRGSLPTYAAPTAAGALLSGPTGASVGGGRSRAGSFTYEGSGGGGSGGGGSGGGGSGHGVALYSEGLSGSDSDGHGQGDGHDSEHDAIHHAAGNHGAHSPDDRNSGAQYPHERRAHRFDAAASDHGAAQRSRSSSPVAAHTAASAGAARPHRRGRSSLAETGAEFAAVLSRLGTDAGAALGLLHREL
jgi:hypothetical protein